MGTCDMQSVFHYLIGHERCSSHLPCEVFKLKLQIDISGTPCEIVLRWVV